jgi:hypothetical protein
LALCPLSVIQCKPRLTLLSANRMRS